MFGKIKIILQEGAGKRTILDTLSLIVMSALIFILPLFFLSSSGVSFQFSKAILLTLAALAAFILWIVARLKDGRLYFPVHLIIGLGILSLIAHFAATVLSPSFSDSFVGGGFELVTFVGAAVLCLLTFLSSVLFRDKKSLFYAFSAFFAAFFITGIFHISRFFLGPTFLSFGLFTDAASNFIGKWNDLAIFFGTGVALATVTAALLPLTPTLRVIVYGAYVLGLALLIVVNFTTSWIVLFLFALLFLIYERFFARSTGAAPRQKTISWLALLTLIVSVIFIIDAYVVIPGKLIERYPSLQFTNNLGTYVSDKLKIIQLETRPSWGTTFSIAKETLKTNPFFGVGPNRFISQWLLYKPVSVNETVFWNTDFGAGIGLIPTLIVTNGIIGLLPLLAFLAMIIFVGARVIARESDDRLARYFTVSSYVATLFGWAFLLLYLPTTTTVAMTFVFTGLFVAALAGEGVVSIKTLSFVENPRVGFLSVLVLIAALILSVFAGYTVTGKFSAALHLEKALNAFNREGDADRTETELNRSIAASPTDAAYRALSELGLFRLGRLLQGNTNMPQDELRIEFEKVLGFTQRNAKAAVALRGENYLNHLSLGRLYEAIVPLRVDGAYESAKASYNEARRLNPHSPEILLILARLEVANRNIKEAKAFIAEALKEKSNYTEAIFFLSQIEVEEGNIKGAIASVESAALISPNDPTVYFQLGFLKYNAKDYRGSVQALERAVGLNPVYANARYFLGLAYSKLGRTTDAIRQFEEIKKSNPDNAELDSIIKNLRAGRDPFASASDSKPERRPALPVKEETGEVE